jgi:anti-sigma28 factor (negative regulator of flagellin synthesis)
MINNINNNEAPGVGGLNLDKPAQSAAATRTSESGVAQSATGSTTAANDSISLSSSPNLVQQALSAGASARSARVQQLKALVQSDQYQPSAQEVSSALITAHLAGD